MNLISLLIFLPLLSLNSQLVSPSANNGGCTLVNNKIYYLGGEISIPKEMDKKQNENIFVLDLEPGITLKDRIAPWKSVKAFNSTPNLKDSYIYSLDDKSQMIIINIFGETEIVFDIVKYDINTNKWTVENKLKELRKLTGELKVSENKDEYGFYYFNNVIQNDLDKNQFIIMEHQIFLDDEEIKEIINFPMIKYDIKSNSFTKLDLKLNVCGGFRFIKEGKYYILGGTPIKSSNAHDIDLLTIVDIMTSKITTQPLTGEVPKDLLGPYNTIFANNKIYTTSIIGENQSGTINVLDLNTFKWEVVIQNIPNLTTVPCITYFNDHLLYSFGANNKMESSNQTVIIDAKNWKEVDTLPQFKNDHNSKDINSSNSGSIINIPLNGGVVGSCVVLILIALSQFNLEFV